MRPLSLGCLLACAFVAACSPSTDVTLLFDRANVDPTKHVLPTDIYQGENGLLDNFSPAQIAVLPFLRQLAATGQTGWAPTTAIRIPFTPPEGEVDLWIDTATAADALRVYQLPKSGAPVPVALGEVRYLEATGALLARPLAPWEPGRYAVAVRNSVLRTHGGGRVRPSPDHTLIIQGGDPRTLADFTAVANVDPDINVRADTLAFFVFTVRDATAQMALLRDYVGGVKPVDVGGQDATIGVMVPPPALGIAVGGAQVLAADSPHVAGFYQAAAGQTKADQLAALAGEAAKGPDQAAAVQAAAAKAEQAILALDTSAIGSIVGGGLVTPNFVSDDGPTLATLYFNGVFLGRTIALPWGPSASGTDNPLSLSKSHPMRAIPYLAFFPKVAPPTGTPVIIALHGLGRSKSDWILFAATACKTGHALIAIDLYQHGDRQAKIEPKEGDFSGKLDTELLKDAGKGFPDPFINPTFLARTRDKLRQSMVDTMALIRILRAANGALPIDFDGDGKPDPAYGPIRIVAMSLGAMVAIPVASVSPEVDRVALTSAGSHISEVVNDSPTIAKQLDPLIYLTGNTPQFGLLADSPRFMVPDGPEREVFSRVSETILAAADPASYAADLVSGDLGAQPRLLVQFAARDLVVPPNAHVRLAEALAAGGDEARPLVQVEPVLYDLGLPVVPPVTLPDGSKAPPPPIAVAQFPAEHGFLLGCQTFYAPLDPFCDLAQTGAAQLQIALFLSLPAGP